MIQIASNGKKGLGGDVNPRCTRCGEPARFPLKGLCESCVRLSVYVSPFRHPLHSRTLINRQES